MNRMADRYSAFRVPHSVNAMNSSRLDDLRICPKCQNVTHFGDEFRTKCRSCGETVWFFDHRPQAFPPAVPKQSHGLWSHPTTTLLLGVCGLFGVVALAAVEKGSVVSAVAALAALGFAAFGFVRHAEARQTELLLENLQSEAAAARAMRQKVEQLTTRYNQLLKTGDQRVAEYGKEILSVAIDQREQAEQLRRQASIDRQAVREVDARIYRMAERLVADHLKWTLTRVKPDPENFQKRKSEVEKAFAFVEGVGYELPQNLRKETLAKLRADFEQAMRTKSAKERQKKLNQLMREEQKLQKERDQAVREAELREREMQLRLDRALREQHDLHDTTVEELRRQLAEAQSSAERAKSMAQLTKAGHVYILSNIGSFGEGVYKVGMTRRLEPKERVHELGDASVPFPFDVHAMISCENAPRLEHELHHKLTRYRVNGINLRKEFFRIDFSKLLTMVRESHGEIDYVAEPEALQYRTSQSMTPQEVVEFETIAIDAGVDLEDDE